METDGRNDVPTKLNPNLKLGRRVKCEGFEGIIRYIGPLVHDTANQGELWVGVEWDDARRGKHDGSVNGHRYFVCRYGSGSLVKPEKLTLGDSISFMTAMRQRYFHHEDPVAEEELYFIDAVTKRTKKVEMVGMEKIAKKQEKFDALRQVSLSSADISEIDEDDVILQSCPNIEDLDIADNYIDSWHTLALLGKQLPNLKILNVSRNKLKELGQDSDTSFLAGCFAQLRVLVLNYTGVQWYQVQGLESYFPALEELHLCGNSISKLISGGTNPFANLTSLDLEENCIDSWSEVATLAVLPRFEKLIINNNRLKTIENSPSDILQHLKSLSINQNLIESWRSINSLHNFPQLQSLRFTNNPVLKDISASVSRQLTIARISRLQYLNGSTITKHERTEAEKFYIRHCLLTSSPDSKDFHVEHPRFNELIEIYGTPAIEKKAAAQSIADELIAVTLQNRASGEGSSVVKQLPSSLTIANLKILCARLFKVDISTQALFYKDSKDNVHFDALDDDTRTLSYYNISENGVVIVEVKQT